MKEKIIKITIIIALVFIVIYNVFLKKLSNNTSKNDIDYIVSNSENIVNSIETKTNEIKIYITGEIKNSGVYELEEGSRVEDAIHIAGGLTEEADLSNVNLAAPLEDAVKIYIPNVNDALDDEKNILSSDSPSSSTSSSNGKININKATASELENIPSVGPSTAQKIITYREENGKFSSIDEIKNVSGIGDKTFENIKDYISI